MGLVARILLWSITAGTGASALSAVLLWQVGATSWRPLAWGAVAVALAAGTLTSRRRRWSDRAIALYLDARLGSRELIATALEVVARKQEPETTLDTPASAFVVEHAAVALEAIEGRLTPRALNPWHLAAPLALGATMLVGTLEAPPRDRTVPAPVGIAQVKSKDVPGLRQIEALAEAQAGDPAQARRLRDISRRARELRERVALGVERREALSALGRLRDDVAAERLNLSGRTERPGLEAAIAELRKHPSLAAAARALGDGDLTAFDEAMRELANQKESESRAAARQALEAAAQKARQRGNERLGRLLEEQAEQLDPNGAPAQALRELAEALRQELGKAGLDEDSSRALEELEASGSAQARRKLAEALGRALAGLSEEERARLAARLSKRLAERGPQALAPLTAEELEGLTRSLEDPDKLEELEESLRELARSHGDDVMERERTLDDAERGGADAQRQLSGVVPVPGLGGGKPSNGPSNPGARDARGSAANGSSEGAQAKPNAHAGQTEPVEAPGLRAKANAAIDSSQALRIAAEGRAAPLVGETANQRGSAELGRVGPVEVGAVERSEVPGEYREHVGRYFSP